MDGEAVAIHTIAASRKRNDNINAATITSMTARTTKSTRPPTNPTFMQSFFAAPSSMSLAQFFSKNSRMLLLLLPPMALAFHAEYVPAGSV